MRFLFGIVGAALSTAVWISGISQVNAAPVFGSKLTTDGLEIVQVNDTEYWKRRNREWASKSRNRRDGWYNGYRGYRNPRNGYRYYNGFWFPGGAFVAGALLGGIIANDGYGGGYGRRYYLDGNQGGSHVQWCYNRYRSYRARDNTFQPYSGQRRQCYSPYD